jgi:hypothetical protein
MNYNIYTQRTLLLGYKCHPQLIQNRVVNFLIWCYKYIGTYHLNK